MSVHFQARTVNDRQYLDDWYSYVSKGHCPRCQQPFLQAVHDATRKATNIYCPQCNWSLTPSETYREAGEISVAGSPAITQADLIELLHLSWLKKLYDRHRQHIVERLLGGAQVQPGPLQPNLTEFSRQSLSWERAAEILPAVFVQQLRQYIEPKTTRTLTVRLSQDREAADYASENYDGDD